MNEKLAEEFARRLSIDDDYAFEMVSERADEIERLQEAEQLQIDRNKGFFKEMERLRAALERIANWNDNQRLTREADDMADEARKVLENNDE